MKGVVEGELYRSDHWLDASICAHAELAWEERVWEEGKADDRPGSEAADDFAFGNGSEAAVRFPEWCESRCAQELLSLRCSLLYEAGEGVDRFEDAWGAQVDCQEMGVRMVDVGKVEKQRWNGCPTGDGPDRR